MNPLLLIHDHALSFFFALVRRIFVVLFLFVYLKIIAHDFHLNNTLTLHSKRGII